MFRTSNQFTQAAFVSSVSPGLPSATNQVNIVVVTDFSTLSMARLMRRLRDMHCQTGAMLASTCTGIEGGSRERVQRGQVGYFRQGVAKQDLPLPLPAPFRSSSGGTARIICYCVHSKRRLEIRRCSCGMYSKDNNNEYK